MAEFDLTAALSGVLNKYSKQIREEISDLIDETGTEMLKEIKENSPVGEGRKRGSYKKGWKMKIEKSALNGKTVTIYNKTDYQLTHLLEKSHLTRDGTSRTTPKPHIKPAEEKYTEKFVEGVEKIIKNAGRNL